MHMVKYFSSLASQKWRSNAILNGKNGSEEDGSGSEEDGSGSEEDGS